MCICNAASVTYGGRKSNSTISYEQDSGKWAVQGFVA